MEFVIGVLCGVLGTSYFGWRIYSHMCRRIRRHQRLDDRSRDRQTQRETIESGRDTVPRRVDYVVSETDLFGTRPGAMTKDHLQDMQKISVKSVDLYPDWTTLRESGSESDQA